MTMTMPMPTTIVTDKAAVGGGARRISSRSSLRECVVADNCGGLLTPEGEYVLAAWCWDIGAEYQGRREYRRGRTVISLPVI